MPELLEPMGCTSDASKIITQVETPRMNQSIDPVRELITLFIRFFYFLSSDNASREGKGMG